MKTVRQQRILELIQMHDIEKQEELVQMLCEDGFDVTQATVSRDISQLRLKKVSGKNALMYLGMRWRLVAHHIFRSGQIHLYTENLIILKISLTGLRPNQTVRIMYA